MDGLLQRRQLQWLGDDLIGAFRDEKIDVCLQLIPGDAEDRARVARIAHPRHRIWTVHVGHREI